MNNYISRNISYLADEKKMKKDEFGRLFDLKRGAISSYIEEVALPKIETLQKISAYFNISIDDLINVDISKKHTEAPSVHKIGKQRNLIPLYNDVSSIGGVNTLAVDMNGQSSPTEWIDAGDWFTEATAAIRHYGDSMEEYPNGCILALKEILNIQLLIPGRDYVIETDEYRITKRIQKSTSPDHVTAYSSNVETYPDGRLIHEPFDIPIESIRRIALVLGYVVKKYSSGMVYTVKKNQ